MDVTELSKLVEQYGGTIYGFCHRLTNNKLDTDDLYQETFLKAVERCQKIDSKNNPKGFLISISIGVWKNNRRKYARRNRIAPLEELDENVFNGSISVNEYYSKTQFSPEDAAISKELKDAIQSAANSLDIKLKIPFYMYYTAEMSNDDIAAVLKIPKGTVKSRLYKARQELKKILEREVGKYE